MPRQEIVGISFAITDHILPINDHGGTIVGGMIGATGFKGIKAIQSGLDYKSPSSAHTTVRDINRISNGVKVAVQGKVQVDFKPEIYLL